ncbi:uncharacterized protein DUF4255 [Paraburkholderia sp. BL27I4N3]|uniref:Pvc16 family protein n=1 Tax=Paraburkholderia sp. BL27I4N3 TaxID=1938805 RepID=UPI000E21D4D6|nr:Pvc16 family protein [Paraburkholderia sp. BL27I4N3]REE18430.1 uncharacterized protein DUF4255 [Paraburkholderia sp. BL27I4N3]
MDAQAIKAVTSAFQQRLQTVINNVFVGPLDDPGAADATAVLFLYRVAVNADLRNALHQPSPSPQDPMPEERDGGLPLDLYYLLTAGSARTGGELETLATLGEAIQNLNDVPYLVGSAVGNEIVRLSLDTVSSDEMGRIWTLFPTANYRTSVVYLATPVWIDRAAVVTPAGPVFSEPHRFGPITA